MVPYDLSWTHVSDHPWSPRALAWSNAGWGRVYGPVGDSIAVDPAVAGDDRAPAGRRRRALAAGWTDGPGDHGDGGDAVPGGFARPQRRLLGAARSPQPLLPAPPAALHGLLRPPAVGHD